MFHTITFVKKRFSSVIITERKNVIQNNKKVTSYKRLKNIVSTEFVLAKCLMI